MNLTIGHRDSFLYALLCIVEGLTCFVCQKKKNVIFLLFLSRFTSLIDYKTMYADVAQYIRAEDANKTLKF